MKKYKASGRIYTIWWLGSGIFTFLYTLLLSFLFQPGSPLFLTGLGIGFGTFAFFTLFYFRKKLSRYTFFIDGEILVIYSGVFLRREGFYSLSRLQGVKRQQTIAERPFHLFYIRLEWMGVGTTLYGLEEKETEEILKRIEPFLLENGGENSGF